MGGGIEAVRSEPTSRAASQSAEGGSRGKQHRRGTGAKRSEVGFGILSGEGEKGQQISENSAVLPLHSAMV